MELVIVIAAIVIIALFSYNNARNKMYVSQRRVSPYKTFHPAKESSKTKSEKTRGKFRVVGYQYLPDEAKNIVWKELKVGDELKLSVDPTNQYDKKAVKVMYKDKPIGWFPKNHDRKIEVYNVLAEGREVKVTCTSNERRQENIATEKADGKGEWNDIQMMTQFVEGRFEYQL